MNKESKIGKLNILLEMHGIKECENYAEYLFWSKVDIKDNKDECWNWLASTDYVGYGHFNINDYDDTLAHRVAYIICRSNIPDDKIVTHQCNNPSCCNPDHLQLGTHSENIQYSLRCDRHSVLTNEHVREIHKLLLEGNLKQSEIAELYNIARTEISRINTGERWGRITGIKYGQKISNHRVTDLFKKQFRQSRGVDK